VITRLPKALVLMTLLVSCATPVSNEPSTTPTLSLPTLSLAESPSAKPTASPRPSVSATPEPTAPDTAREIAVLASTVNGLLLRTGPSLDFDPFVVPCEPVDPAVGACAERVVIDDGWTMVALGSPVVTDEYEWHLVQLTPNHPGSAHLGWVANPVAGDPWLVSSSIDCPAAPPELSDAIDLGQAQLLYCYGDEELTLDGFVVTGFGCNIGGTFEPAWLAHPCANMSFISPTRSSDGDGRLFLHYPAPGVINPTLEIGAGAPVRIVGHFDDDAAASCRIEAAHEADSPPALRLSAADQQADVALCRLRFVVTAVENLIAQ
jgi:hypothetical protein